MFYTYVIKSNLKDWVYVGITEDVDARLKSHNNKEVKSTKAYAPFYLLFVQVNGSRNEARDLEKFLKIRWNKESLLELLCAGGGMVYAYA